jgi:hypothetical protein
MTLTPGPFPRLEGLHKFGGKGCLFGFPGADVFYFYLFFIFQESLKAIKKCKEKTLLFLFFRSLDAERKEKKVLLGFNICFFSAPWQEIICLDAVSTLSRGLENCRHLWYYILCFRVFAGVAQLVEQRTCNAQVIGSIPIAGSRF